MGQLGRVVDAVAGAKDATGVAGLPRGGSGQERVGFRSRMGVKRIVDARGLIKKTKTQIRGVDGAFGTDQCDNRFAGGKVAGLQRCSRACLPRQESGRLRHKSRAGQGVCAKCCRLDLLIQHRARGWGEAVGACRGAQDVRGRLCRRPRFGFGQVSEGEKQRGQGWHGCLVMSA